ncbi:putative integral membrane protein [Thermosporothrix hazakensis]|jgi:uncharacterized integral membrane protein|uniref:Lipopolysaccharide assembly protein A domain-containing protein n=2 Tax=Thermosporothrix TaxID=768650 RepID=A0A455SNZ0_9CHLR|nr:lipopolysaccharide assembly protein LapA domain-containing protein [Thermosporothrix hazakensis]PZW36424.1 putative integral membrane protein [Thermosporothrix hazakensis]BBH88891.1 hypothetical protein KTC_36420 [Thermosporothrix sp. COM3]GCE47076.1 hypothetical protein KTH_19450 [Thermosporothrix hazakensis]
MIYLMLVILGLIGALVAMFSVQNLDQVTLSFFSLQLSLPVGIIFIATFLIGAILLYLVDVAAGKRDKREIARLQKENERLQKRVSEMEKQLAATQLAQQMMQPQAPLSQQQGTIPGQAQRQPMTSMPRLIKPMKN